MEKHIRDFAAALAGFSRNVRRLFSIMWRHERRLVVGVLVFGTLISAMPFVQDGALAIVLNELATAAGTSTVTTALFAAVAVLIAARLLPELFGALHSYVDRRLWINMQERFELMLLEARGRIDVASHEDPDFRDLLNRATERGVHPMANLLDSQFTNLQNVISVGIASAVILGFEWWWFLLAVVAAVPRLSIEMRLGKSMWGIYDANAEDRRRFFHMRMHFSHLPWLKELKVFQNTSHFYSKVAQFLHSFNKEHKELEATRMRWRIAAALWGILAIGAIIVLVVREVVVGSMQIGTMMFALAAVGRLQGSLAGFFQRLGRQRELNLFVADMFAVLDRKPVVKEVASPHVLHLESPPLIAFENVSFTYPGTEKQVLRDINLRIEPGEKVALVGENGAGKSTFVRLLARFYDPTDGRVVVDGTDLRTVVRESWYRHMAILSQQFGNYRFLAVKENIGLGRTNGRSARKQAVIGPARISDADSFIQELPDRYDQMLGKQYAGGVDLSDGQEQTMALARAIFRDAEVLVLDEPTAMLDPKREDRIFTNLERELANKTLILISHRFCTVRNVDRIIVLEEGTIGEEGSHEELMALGGTYAEMFTSQAKYYQV